LFTDKSHTINVASKLKLLNINAAAQLRVPGFKGLFGIYNLQETTLVLYVFYMVMGDGCLGFTLYTEDGR
jgi:hypothetical protein